MDSYISKVYMTTTTINIGSPTTSNTSVVSYNYQKTQIVSTGQSFYFQSRLQTNNFSYINTSSSGQPKSIKGIAERGFFIPKTHDTTDTSIIGELVIGHKTYSGDTFLVCFPLRTGSLSSTDIDKINVSTNTNSSLYLDLNSIITYDCPNCKLNAYDYKVGERSSDIVQIFYHTNPIRIKSNLGNTTTMDNIIKDYCNYPNFSSGTAQNAIQISGPKVEKPISITGGSSSKSADKKKEDDNAMDFFNLNTMMKLVSFAAMFAMILVLLRVGFDYGMKSFVDKYGFYIYTAILVVFSILLVTLFFISIDNKGRVKSGKKYEKMHSASIYFFIMFIIMFIDYSNTGGIKEILSKLSNN